MPELLIAGVILIALIAYTLTGGADFGGGVWDLLASKGDEGRRQRDLIARTIAPIWEANHVWLIVVIVLMFVCFPSAFAAISTALHVPLTLMLIGIILRGSAFVFRAYGSRDDREAMRWGRIFAISSVITPVFLGITLGAVVSGRLTLTGPGGQVETDFISEWLSPFPIAVGLFCLSLFALLAAVYLLFEADDDDDALRAAFRTRALGAAVVTGVLSVAVLWTSTTGAPALRAGLLDRPWAMAMQGATGAAALGGIAALWRGHLAWARALIVAQAVMIVGGLGLALYPNILPPHLSLWEAAAPDAVLWTTFGVLCVGLLALIPTLWFLYRVFAKQRA